MNEKHLQRFEKGALEILEEATQLLRRAPAAILLQYYAGSLPFVLGLLFFWSDMSQSATARSHLATWSLALSVLYVWMKCWQAVFASSLIGRLEGESVGFGWGPRRIVRLIGVQLAVMPWQFVVLPLALIVTLPYGWCHAFFHNVTVTGSGREGLLTSVRSARNLSMLWPVQNHKLILILCGFFLAVLFNLCMLVYMLPTLLSTLWGVESIFSKSNTHLLHSTFWLSMAGVTYLCVNPLVRAAYVLRCYSGESLASGKDLWAELRRLRRRSGQVFPLLLAACLLALSCMSGTAAGADSDHEATAAWSRESVSPAQLDNAIGEVINRLEYTWRVAPKELEEEELSPGFLKQALETIMGWLRKVRQWGRSFMEWLWEWLEKLFPATGKDESPLEWKGFGTVQFWLTVALGSCVCLGVWQFLRLRKRRLSEGEGGQLHVQEGELMPDLTDESLLADDLPAARWLSLAKELLEARELRLAIRALHFVALSTLADRSLLSIARHKSNRDYERELKRRAHAMPRLIQSFSENVIILERVWYGNHQVGQDGLDRFMANLHHMGGDIKTVNG